MHIYTCENGVEVPSVTTILKMLGSEAIIRWANYLGFKRIDYDDEMDRTSNIGTKIHECVRSVIDPSACGSVTFANEYDAVYYDKITNIFRENISKFKYETIFTEKTFASSKLGYGGTLDWYCKMGSLRMLNDFKSSKQVRLKHLLQLGGYTQLLEENGYEVDAASIIIINDRGSSMYPIDRQTLTEMGVLFNKLAEIYVATNGGNSVPHSSDDIYRQILK